MSKVLNKTEISFFVSFVFMISGALSLVGLIYIIEGNVIDLREKSAAIAHHKAQEAEKYESERLLDETKEERAILASFVITEESVIGFITNIEKLAGSLGLEFNTKTITPEVTKEDKNFDELSMQFSFSGPELSVKKLISVFETIPHHSYIRDLSIRQSEGGLVWTVDMTLVVTTTEYD